MTDQSLPELEAESKIKTTDVSGTTLRITEIFHSLQGEAQTVGCPTVFVRLTGCPLRCRYCDTEYAFSGGELHTLDSILDSVAQHGAQYVCVTGGEPLAQPDCLILLSQLCDAGYQVSLETSGALSCKDVDLRVSKVLDLKTPASGEASKNLYENIQYLTVQDQVKFVICNREDYEWARFKIEELKLANIVGELLFSPSHHQLQPKKLAEWILEDKLSVRFQLQQHKLIWGEENGH